MKKVLVLKGLPASGKSTYAKSLIDENPGSWKRINKDDLRAMLDNSYHSKGNEQFIIKIRDLLIREALTAGKHVVIDDTNLASKHETRIRQVVDIYKKETGQEVKVEVKFFDTPLEECIKRDLKRPVSVGEKVIRDLYKQHFLGMDDRDPKYMEQDQTLPKAIICDIDGTLAILKRNPFDASRCEEDGLNQPVYKVVQNYHNMGYEVILLSGRTDNFKVETERWLKAHNVPYDQLIMRKAGDSRKDAIIKKEFFEQKIQGQYFIEFVLDDRNQVVDMWRTELRLPCLQVNYGDF